MTASNDPHSPAAPLPAALERRLSELLGPRLSTAEAVREHHARGEGWDRARLPAAVAFPRSDKEVAALLAACHEARVPVVPFGAGSSLEGHVVPPADGISLDLRRMDAILEVSAEDLDCRVQAGVTRLQLERALGPQGLFFPIDPGADATIGGMIATGASGTMTVRYGTMRDNVLGLRVVLADGSVIHTGSRARKSSAGYDLTRLFVGSEGTLGVVTEARLRLRGVPEAILAATCHFEAIEGAVETVVEAILTGVPLARSELVDELQMHGFNLHSGLGAPERPTLFFEFHGTPASVAEQSDQVREICLRHGGSEYASAALAEERARLWRARHDAYFAALALAPGKRGMVTDACVPLSRLAECLRETRRDIRRHGLLAPIVGHVGDGNFHCMVLCDPDDEGEIEAGRAFVARLAERAIDMGGTCTGEHGVGSGKVAFLHREHGRAVRVMRAIKAALDPRGILNPGKVLGD